MIDYIGFELPKEKREELDKIFKKDGMIVPVPSAEIATIPFTVLRMYCHHEGIYQIVTNELVDFMRDFVIKDKKAIEIGCGHGTLGRALGIPFTDSKLQEREDMVQMYEAMGQPIISYPEDVIKLDALQAVRKYKPQVVIGCWITRWIDPNGPPKSGNPDGVDMKKLINSGIEMFTMAGSMSSHHDNPLLKSKQVRFLSTNFPFLFSRSNPMDNRIFSFKPNKIKY